MYYKYNRETNNAAFLSYTKLTPNSLSFYDTQITNPFLNSIISANNEKLEEFRPMHWQNPYTPYCFCNVESL